MKRIILLILGMLIFASMIFALSSCNLFHEHKFTVESVSDATLQSAASCTSLAKYYYSCECGEISADEVFESGEMLPHTEEIIPGVAPTCTKGGYSDGKVCTVCNRTLAKQEDLPANGHNPVVDAAVAATCTETGLTEGKHCADCGKVVRVQEIVPAKGHTSVVDAAVAPTCTEVGFTEGAHCSVCNVVLVAQEQIPALGHTEVDDEAKDATCVDFGLTAGKHCSVCNAVTVPQDVILAFGHTETVDVAVAPTCTETGLTEGKHCTVCDAIIVKQQIVDALGHTEVVDVAVAPTCTATGLTEGKHCSVCNVVLTAQEVVPANGHSFESAECKNCDVVDVDFKSANQVIEIAAMCIPEETATNYTLVTGVIINGKSYTVEWRVVGTDAVVVEVGRLLVTASEEAEITYILQYTITNEYNDDVITGEYEKVVPQLVVEDSTDVPSGDLSNDDMNVA